MIANRRYRLLAPLLAALLAAIGCAPADDWLQTYPDVAARAREQPGSVAVEARRQWNDVRGMVGSYEVRASRGISSRTINTQISLLRDGYVTIEALAPTGSTEGYLTAGDLEVGFWASDENRLYRGPNDPGAFARALGLELDPEQIVAVLMGFAIPSGTAAPTAVWDGAARRVRVADDAVTAWLHPVSMRFERVVVDTPTGAIEIDYELWSEEGPPVPLRLRVRVASEDITLALRLAREWSQNPRGLDAAYFDVYPVAAATEAPLSMLAAEGGLLRRGLRQ